MVVRWDESIKSSMPDYKSDNDSNDTSTSSCKFDNMNSKERNARRAEIARNYRLRKKNQSEAVEKIIKNLEIDNQKQIQKIEKLEKALFLLRFYYFDTCFKNALKLNNNNNGNTNHVSTQVEVKSESFEN